MGSTKASGGLKESGGTVTDPERPFLRGLAVGEVVVTTGLDAQVSDICRTEGLEICFMAEYLCTQMVYQILPHLGVDMGCHLP